MDICLIHSHSILKYFELYIISKLKKQTFSIDALQFFFFSNCQLNSPSNCEGIAHISNLGRCFEVTLYYSKFIMQLDSSCCHSDCCFVVTGEFFQFSYIFQEDIQSCLLRYMTFPHDDATITWKWHPCLPLSPTNLSIKQEARGCMVSDLE